MMSITRTQQTRDALLRRLPSLARRVLFGTLSKTYGTCGRAGCRCPQGHKHGPPLYVSFRGPDGPTTEYSVPQAVAEPRRHGGATAKAASASGSAGTASPRCRSRGSQGMERWGVGRDCQPSAGAGTSRPNPEARRKEGMKETSENSREGSSPLNLSVTCGSSQESLLHRKVGNRRFDGVSVH